MPRGLSISMLMVLLVTLIMLGGGCVKMTPKPQIVSGIDAYRSFSNRSFEPYFSADLPSNWLLEEFSLRTQKGHWISLRGPANSSNTRVTSLDFYLIARGPEPQYQSLDAFMAFSIRQESFGEPRIILAQPRLVDGLSGQERKISYDRAYPTASGIVRVSVVKQWTTMFIGNNILQVLYESPQETFETYFIAYLRALDSLTFLK